MAADLTSASSTLTAFSDDLLGSVAELVATGEAWADAAAARRAATADSSDPLPVPTSSLSPVSAVNAAEAQSDAVVPAQPLGAAVVDPAPIAAPPAAPVPVGLLGAPSPPAPISEVVHPAAAPVTATPAPPSARSSLEQALAQLLPAQNVPVPQQLRVQLGFRDGTSTTLDPGSTQALALEELAQSLTRRD